MTYDFLMEDLILFCLNQIMIVDENQTWKGMPAALFCSY